MIVKRIYNLQSSEDKKRSMWLSFMALLRSLLNFAGLASLFPLLKMVLEEHPSTNKMMVVFGAIFLFILVKNLLVMLLTKVQTRYLMNQYRYYSSSLFEQYYKKGLLFIKESGPVALTNDVTSVSMVFCVNVLQGLYTIVAESFLVLFIFAALVWYSPLLSFLMIAVMIPLVAVYAFLFKGKMQLCGKEEMDARRQQSRIVVETFRGFSELEVYDAYEKQMSAFSSGLKTIAKYREKIVMMFSIPSLLTELALVFGLALLLLIQGANSALLGGAFALAAFRLMPAFRNIVSAWSTIQQSTFSVDLLEKNLTNKQEDETESEKIPFRHELKMENVSFSFSDGTSVFQNYSMSIQKGERIGFCGVSGSGKSTLFNLLLGFYQPQEGRVLIDDKELNHSTHSDWLRQVGYVPQDVYILQGTLAENVAMGQSDVSEDKIKEVLCLSCLLDWAESLPNGIHTQMGEAGSRMSGGQRQRIGIARAIYKSPEVLFLDEATSSVDTQTEQEINQTLQSLSDNCKELTIVVIAHRESSLAFCSRIISINS